MHQKLTGVCVDEVQGVFQHIRRDLLKNDQITTHSIFALPHFSFKLCSHLAALGHEQLPEELGPHGQDVLVGRKGAIASLKGYIVDAVHFIGLIEKVPEVLGEGGWRNTGNLIQAGLNRGRVQTLLTHSFKNREHKHSFICDARKASTK